MDLLQQLDDILAADLDAAALKEALRAFKQGLAARESAAQERRQLLQAVVDAAPVAIVLLDEVGTIAFANAGARELFFESERAEGLSFIQLLGSAPETLRAALLAETDHIFSFEHRGDLETYHFARRELTLGGVPYGLLVVRPMTFELSRRENQVLRKTIRVIHHELANSLTPVISLLRTARGKIGKPEQAPKLEQMLSVIEDRVMHLNAFLTGFAALGKLPKPRPQDVSWETFLSQLRPLLADITVGAAPPGSGWVDAAQLQQVAINLVKNAREAGSEPAEIVLEVQVAPEGGFRLSVLDRGRGMNDEVLENAMVPTFTTKPNGSGMGLALCREILDAHHGQLRIARREGGGMAVSCWLPAREAQSPTLARSRGRLTLSRT